MPIPTHNAATTQRGASLARRAFALLCAAGTGAVVAGPRAVSLAAAQAANAPPAPSYSPIVELRQYTLRPKKRDVLIDLFEREFVEPQEALGIKVIGEFRDLDDPNHFVWLRGFHDMPSRAIALAGFYDGALWKSLRDSANATIVDNDNVLLLRPVRPGTGFALDSLRTTSRDASGAGKGLVVGTIYHIDAAREGDFADFFERSVAPLIARAGARVLAEFVCERSANTFPRLPVREGEHVFVWFARFHDEAGFARFNARLASLSEWQGETRAEFTSRIREPQVLRLSPTARSLLHD